MNIQYDNNTIWKSEIEGQSTLFLAGTVFLNDEKLSIKELLNILEDVRRVEDLSNLTKKFKGQFGFIFKNSFFSIAFVDKIRSFPISSYKIDNELHISNSTKHFDTVKDKFTINIEALEVFKSSGYTIGKDTFYKEFEILESGTFIFLDIKSKILVREKYFSFFNEKAIKYSDDEVLKEIDKVITVSIKRLIKIANGKKIVIPLSAGLDSRLILGKLIELGYKDIFTFTYGPKNIWEREAAEKCANHLNVPWFFVELNKKEKKRFYTDDRKEYYKFASNNNSVPHIADYYALNILKEKGILDFKNIILVNGQTGDFITGGHVPININEITLHNIYETLINKHFALWFNKITPKFKNFIKGKLQKSYKFHNYFSNKNSLFKEYERFECNERQIKYVINGQRIYDWLDIEWYLPLWSAEMLSFWSSIDLKHKLNQDSFKEYCKVFNPGNTFDVKLNKRPLSLPYYLYPVLVLLKIISKVNKKHKYSRLKRTYLSFYEKYYPFYPQKTYANYLKDAKYHRSPVSYWVETYLNENNLKNRF